MTWEMGKVKLNESKNNILKTCGMQLKHCLEGNLLLNTINEEKLQINNHRFYLKKYEKEQMKPTANRRK